MNIEIPIQGQSASGGNIPPVQPPNQPIQPITPPNQPTPPNQQNQGLIHGNIEMNSRMVEDVRREMQQRGVLMVPGSSSMSQIINQYGSNLKSQENSFIHNKYENLRDTSKRSRDFEISEIENRASKEAQKYINLMTSGAMTEDEARKAWMNSPERKKLEKEKELVEKDYQSDVKSFNEKEESEKRDVDKDLTKAIRDLTRYFEREARQNINEDSYINQLRKQREEAIFERDNAQDEEQARDAAKRANELNNKIKNVIDEGKNEENEEPNGKDFGARILQMMSGVNQLASGITNRNVGSMITGAGGVITNLIPMSDESQANAMKWISGLGMFGTLLSHSVDRENQMGGLAAVIRKGERLEDVRYSLYDELFNYQLGENFPSIFEMGLDETAFAKSAERRISQRGIGGWKGVEQAYYQEGLERALSLSSGSLGQAGMFDRYGVNITDAISNLVVALERDKFSGVRKGDYARVDEYLKLQQGIMQSQLSFAGTPSYDYANSMISRFANFQNYTVDSRTGGDIQALQSMILNPQNDRQKAILYGVVEKMFPETRGRMDKIEQTLQDPDKMAKIQQGYIQDIQKRYGGFDTEMGYFAAKAALPGIGSSERLRSIWNGMLSDNYNVVKGDGIKDEYMRDIKGYTSDITSSVTQLSEWVQKLFVKISGFVDGTESVNIRSVQ